jgi:tetratricopeptide (TPR) repeat protein
LLTVPCFLWAQPDYFALPDSIAIISRQYPKEDTARVSALNNALEYFVIKTYQNKQDTPEDVENHILFLINEICHLSDKIGYPYGKAKANYSGGYYYFLNGDFVKSLQYFITTQNLLLKLSAAPQNQQLLFQTYILKSDCYMTYSMFSESFEDIQKAQKLSEEFDNHPWNFVLNCVMAEFYRKMNYTEKTLTIYKEILNDSTLPAISKYAAYSSIVDIYNELQEPDSAQIYMDSIFCYRNPGISPTPMLLSQGDIYAQKKNFEAAMKYYREASETPNNLLINQAEILVRMANANYHLKKYPDALDALSKSMEIAETYFLYEIQKQGLEIKINIMEALGKYKDALQVEKVYRAVTDSLEKKQNKEHVRQLMLQKEMKTIEEHAKINLLIEQQKHQQQQIKLIIGLSFFALLSIIVFLFFCWKNASLQTKKAELKNKEMELDLRNRELTSNILSQIQKNELLNDIISHLKKLESEDSENIIESVHKLIYELKQAIAGNLRQDFDYYFVQTHPNFYNSLLTDYPLLTQHELHLCAFLKLNLTTKDIAAISNISPDSVKTARKRLRKSLRMNNPNDNFANFFAKY